jgi:Protein of unknown function (DUF993)
MRRRAGTDPAFAGRCIGASRIYSGAGTDHFDPTEAHSLDDAIRAYLEQIEAIERLDERIILMAGRALAQVAKLPKDYEIAYLRVLSARDRAGDPALARGHVRWWAVNPATLGHNKAPIGDISTKWPALKFGAIFP